MKIVYPEPAAKVNSLAAILFSGSLLIKESCKNADFTAGF